MPLFFTLAIHNALLEVQKSLLPGEHLLDDINVLCQPHRTHEVYNIFGRETLRTSTRARQGRGMGICPPRMQDLGPDVWNPEGITPVGSDVFIEEFSRVRVQEESKLWEALSWVPDVQCAWQILLQCVGPYCHHFLRTVPFAQSATCTHSHDVGMWTATETVFGRLPGNVQQKDMARCLATLPMRLGGLGLRLATRMGPAAYWASWADAFPMISARLPSLGGDLGSHDR